MALALGVATLLMGVALTFILPGSSRQLPAGFWTPIIAFEFATTPDEVEGILSSRDGGTSVIDAMDLGNRVDYMFLLCYGGFLAVTASLVAELRGNAFRVAGALAIVAAGSDAFENVQLLEIVRAVRAGTPYDKALQLLAQATWTKWGALLVALVWLSPWLWRGGRAGRAAAAFAWVGALSGVAAFLQRGVANEVMALAVAGAYVGMLVVVVQFYRRPTLRDPSAHGTS